MTEIEPKINAMETLIEDLKERMRAGVYPDSFILDGAMEALAALREKQEREKGCEGCTGILYRQTESGKVIPAESKCKVMPPPHCFKADGDNGCAYMIPDGDDEPLDACKACPHCYGDKTRKPTGGIV